MKRCNIILRMLSAVALALGLVLIPLSQAEATSCSDLAPGESTWYCGSTCYHVDYGYYVFIKYWDTTITRPTDAPHCTTNRFCGDRCTHWTFPTGV